jgi:hypothetical protein
MTTETMTLEYTLTDLKQSAILRGYIVKKLDGEIEIYPKGKRGDASYFTTDTVDAFQTMRLDFVQRQTDRIKEVTARFHHLLEAEAALIQYATASSRIDWTDRLFGDWYRAGSTTVDSDTYATLHRLRNHPDGHELLREIANH